MIKRVVVPFDPAREPAGKDGESAEPRPGVWPDDWDDERLLARVAEGDRRAFDRLYHRVHPRLFRFAARLTRRADLVDEVVNDTMLVVWRQARDFSGRARVTTWILGIAHNIGKKALSRAVRVGEVEALDDALACDRISPEDVAHGRSVGDRLTWALSRLSPEHRMVIELTFVHGHRYREIAEILDCPVATVKTRMFNARARLRRLMADTDDEPAAARQRGDEIDDR